MIVTYYDKRGIRITEEMIGTAEEIRERLSEEGKTIIDMKTPSPFLWRRFDRGELAAILMALADLLRSGVTLHVALDTAVISLSRGSRLRPVFANISQAVKDGKLLSTAMADYKDIFNEATIAMIQASEQNSELSHALMLAGDYAQRTAETHKENWKRLIYPLVVSISTIIGLLVNTFFVIPNLMKSPLMQMAGNKTQSSQVYIDILNLISRGILVFITVVIVLVAFVFIAKRAGRYGEGHNEMALTIERQMMKIPLVKELSFYNHYYIAFYSLTTLLRSVPRMEQALQIVARASKSETVRNDLERAVVALEDGEHFATALNLKPIEKTMLTLSKNQEQQAEKLGIVAERFQKAYFEQLAKIGPYAYTVALALAGLVFLCIVQGIFVPYSQIIKNIGG